MKDFMSPRAASPRTLMAEEKASQIKSIIQDSNKTIIYALASEVEKNSFSVFAGNVTSYYAVNGISVNKSDAFTLSSMIPFVPTIDAEWLKGNKQAEEANRKENKTAPARRNDEDVVFLSSYLAAVKSLAKYGVHLTAAVTGLDAAVIRGICEASPEVLLALCQNRDVKFYPRFCDKKYGPAFYKGLLGHDTDLSLIQCGAVINKQIADAIPDFCMAYPSQSDRRLMHIAGISRLEERKHDDSVYCKIRDYDEAYFLEENGIRWTYAYLLTNIPPSWKSWLFALHTALGNMDEDTTGQLRFYPETDQSRMQITYFLLMASSLLRDNHPDLLLDTDPVILAMMLLEQSFMVDLVGMIPNAETIPSVSRDQCFDAILNFLSVDQATRRPGREEAVTVNARWLRAFVDREALPRGSFLSRCPTCQSVHFVSNITGKGAGCSLCGSKLAD